MRIGLLTREFPPEVYGGAGVHVEFLARELRRIPAVERVEVRAFGAARSEAGVLAFATPPALAGANAALQSIGTDIEIAAALEGLDILHSHTWYANLAGLLGGMLHGVPHVLTAHSLEPLRPWKAEQLGGGYRISSWIEREAYASADAVIAVSAGMRQDVLQAYPFVPASRVHVIHNGIDASMYSPASPESVAQELAAHGIDGDRPIVLFVGRITRQKGVAHLLGAAAGFDPGVQLVFCAGAPDTPEIRHETEASVALLQSQREGVHWIQEMLPRERIISLLTAATVFVCPSVYEPQGIVNLEAMGCETAVVASDVGGIPEVVADGETGVLVHYSPDAPREFESALAAAVNALASDPARAAQMGRAGRARALEHFGWDTLARRTVELYATLV
ncbi:MAG: glycosyl transferase family 1 [Pseudonocardiales bacterium]|nr:glycosyl transferase family 1 [Pseudonocardiales bacterium]